MLDVNRLSFRVRVRALAIVAGLTFLRCAPAETPRSPLDLTFVADSSSAAPIFAIRPSSLMLKEDGQLCPISSLRYPSCGLPPNSPRPSVPAGLVVLLLDASHFFPQAGSGQLAPNAATEPLRKTASEVLHRLPENAPVAIYTSDLNLKVIRDFPDGYQPDLTPIPKLSSNQIEKAADVFQKQIPSGPVKTVLHVVSAEAFELAELESIANHLAKLPGRKSLVWFCEGTGFPVPPPEGPLYYPWFSAMVAARRANLAVYPVLCGTKAPKSLKAMANITGGRFYSQYTDLPHAVEDALQDTRCSYQLSSTSATIQRRPIHQINLVVSQRAIHLIYPKLYVEPVLPRRLDLRLKATEAGLATPLRAYGIIIGVTTQSITRDSALVEVSLARNEMTRDINQEPPAALLDVVDAYYDSNTNRIPAGVSRRSHD